MAGLRDYSSANITYQGSYGFYWSSSRLNETKAYALVFLSSGIYTQSDQNRGYGISIRCFKNSPTVPTSSWTKLY